MGRFSGFLLCLVLLASCGNGGAGGLQGGGVLRDGYYTAQALNFDSWGWKEFVSIYVKNNRIVTVEYNGENERGFVKSWDMPTMHSMNQATGTYPNKFSRSFVVSLLNRQDPDRIDAVAGATQSWIAFRTLAKAAMEQARKGEKGVAFIEVPEFIEGP
jgi:major membrane immunogen (membrane-anchored lipoprotein)